MLREIKGKPVIQEGETFYSIYFEENDPNYASQVEILEHESCFTMDRETFNEDTTNWFLTRKQAEKARERVIKALRLK